MCEPRNGEHGWSGSTDPHRTNPRSDTPQVVVSSSDEAEADQKPVDIRQERETPEYTGGS